MQTRWMLVTAGVLVARSALADPPQPDPGLPAMTPPGDPQPSPQQFPPPDPPAMPDPSAPVSDVVEVPPGTPVPGLVAGDRPILIVHDRPGRYSYAWNDPGLVSGIGVGFTVGGGVTGFTDRTMRDTVSSNVGGLWDARASFGTHIPIGLDVSYLGSAARVNTIAGAANGTLVGTTVEAALRYNILPHNVFNPYLFAGAGWQRYDVTDMRFAQSDTGMKPHDDVAEFPMGVGFGIRDASGFNFDLRGTFRATTDSTLVLDGATGKYADLHAWEASGALGYEF
jgi:hypothetical protein